jgi:hypothetical protein
MELNGMYAQQPTQDLLPFFPPALVSLGEFLVGATIVGLAVWGVAELIGQEAPLRICGACGQAGHDRRTCPHDGPRLNFSRSLPRGRRCQCCASPRYEMQRHHTRGRSNLSDFLDVCLDCHLECCHDGDFRNLGRKPRTCRQTGNISAWRNRPALKLMHATNRGS